MVASVASVVLEAAWALPSALILGTASAWSRALAAVAAVAAAVVYSVVLAASGKLDDWE